MGFSSTGAAIVAVVAGAAITSCGGATDNPLGGPFGGTIQESVSPTQGTAPDASSSSAPSGNLKPAPTGGGSGSGAPSGSSSGSVVDPGSGGGNSGSGGSSSSSSSGATSGSSSGSVGPTSSSSSSSGSSSGSHGSSSSSSSSSGSSGSTSSSSSGGMGNGPSWSMTIYANDLNQKTCGGLGCHLEFSAAGTAYNYLQSQGCLPAMGCIKGIAPTGNMPVIGNLSSSAVADIQAWVAAGSQNN